MHPLERIRTYLQARLDERRLTSAWNAMMRSPVTRHRVDRILECDEADPRVTDSLEERWLPGLKRCMASGYWRTMLTRYALAVRLARHRVVADTCCGLGWGAYLVDAVASEVIALDNDGMALGVAASLWPTERTVFLQASVLAMPLRSESVDLVLAMESIEHFSLEHIECYLNETQRILKTGGCVLGSSAFPETSEEADALCRNTPAHLHICTRPEMFTLLRARFRRCRILGHSYFWAEK